MKYCTISRFSGFFLLLPVFLFIFSSAMPVQAEEVRSERSRPDVSEPKDTIPLEPDARVYADYREEAMKRFIYIASLDAAYTLSDSDVSDRLHGGDVRGLLATRYIWNESVSASLIYNGTYYKRLDFYSDEIGPRERTEYQGHNITPLVRYNFGDNYRYSVIPSFFYTRTYNKDVEGGGWSDGLYNYRDTGGGLGFIVKDLGFGAGESRLRFDVQYYKRRYPNYDSLLDLATGIGIEEDERDYKGLLGKIDYNLINDGGISFGANYFLLYKKLDGKKVVDSNGVLTSDEQRDYLHNLGLRFWHNIIGIQGDLRTGLDLNFSVYDSNQNYYDGMGTDFPILEDDVYLNDFYDYISYRVSPNISYTFSALPLTVLLSYSFQLLDYTDRMAQRDDPQGSYKDDEQWERQHGVNVGLRYQMREKLAFYTRYYYLDVRSNNDYSATYDYDHTIHTGYFGVSISY